MRGAGRRRGWKVTSHPADNECPRCGLDMEDRGDMRKTSAGRWVHRWCMGGGDDE